VRRLAGAQEAACRRARSPDLPTADSVQPPAESASVS
jgi:hypothetical protein